MNVWQVYKEQIDKLKKGDSITVKCLRCGGKLFINKSSFNGHIFIACSNGDYKLWT